MIVEAHSNLEHSQRSKNSRITKGYHCVKFVKVVLYLLFAMNKHQGTTWMGVPVKIILLLVGSFEMANAVLLELFLIL